MDHSVRSALADIRNGLVAHRGWRTFAVNDVVQRHRRTVFGRLWIVGTMAITVASVGFLYAGVLQLPPQAYVPFIAAGLVVWQLISGSLGEASSVFTGSEGLIKAVPLERTFFVARLIYRNMMVFAINLSIVGAALVIFPPEDLTGLLFAPIGLLLVLANLFWLTFLLGILATRFRDVAPFTGSAVQVLFLLTPVIYQPAQVADQLSWVIYMNPLASLVAVVRDPLLGQLPGAASITVCVVMAVLGSAATLLVFARARPQIAVWL